MQDQPTPSHRHAERLKIQALITTLRGNERAFWPAPDARAGGLLGRSRAAAGTWGTPTSITRGRGETHITAP